MRKIRAAFAVVLIAAILTGAMALSEGNFFTALIIGASRENGGYSDALAMLVMSYGWDGNGTRLLILDRDEAFEGESLGDVIRLYGEKGALRAVNEMYGLDIVNTVILDMNSVPSIVGNAGGVDMEIDGPDAEILGLTPGTVSMDAAMVEKYIGITLTDDEKTEANNRRSKVLNALIDKIQASGINVSFDLVWTLLGMMNTNISFFDMVSLGTSVMSSGLGGVSRAAIPLNGEGTQAELVKGFLYN